MLPGSASARTQARAQGEARALRPIVIYQGLNPRVRHFLQEGDETDEVSVPNVR